MTSTTKTSSSVFFFKWRKVSNISEDILPDWAKEDQEKSLPEAMDIFISKKKRKASFFAESELNKIL